MKELLDLEYCECGRSWCQFFNAGEGDRGVSYSIEDVEEMLAVLPKLERHLKKQLKLYQKQNPEEDKSTEGTTDRI